MHDSTSSLNIEYKKRRNFFLNFLKKLKITSGILTRNPNNKKFWKTTKFLFSDKINSHDVINLAKKNIENEQQVP